ncbi:hypothetical protein QR680_018000 [Steinernema hermaphroditum]|uniref:G-protein coupled receptors family 1 profile domain-containing protein n=1 Tax=Steinernema hermaphroditum TaxID=289476 RepID=A0AA39HGK0_9BILA|nr:hypothetical protein QR680_018000 [Steinernema hermaphroditum]
MNASVCLQAQLLASSSFYKLLLCYHISLCVTSSISVLLILKMQSTVFPLHRNLRVILGVHLFYCLLQSTGFAAVHLANLIRLSAIHNDPCDYLLPTAYVFNFRQIAVLGIYGEILTLACVSIERTFASVMQQYERRKITLLVALLGFGQFIVVVGLFYAFIAVDIDWTSYVATFNVRTEGAAWKFKLIVYIGTAIELVSIVTFHALLFINKRRRRLQSRSAFFVSLSARYQIAENVNAMSLLVPAVWMHFFVFTSNSVTLMVYDRFGDKTNKVAAATFLDASNIVSFYPILVALFVFVRYPKARQNLFNARGKTVVEITPQKNEGDLHFDYLRAMLTEKPKTAKKRCSCWAYLCCC